MHGSVCEHGRAVRSAGGGVGKRRQQNVHEVSLSDDVYTAYTRK